LSPDADLGQTCEGKEMDECWGESDAFAHHVNQPTDKQAPYAC